MICFVNKTAFLFRVNECVPLNWV